MGFVEVAFIATVCGGDGAYQCRVCAGHRCESVCERGVCGGVKVERGVVGKKGKT